MARFYALTTGWCPECRELIPAGLTEEDGCILLDKMCPVHGSEKVLISRDVRRYKAYFNHIRPGVRPKYRFTSDFKGCPDSCGLCPQHRQHTCLPIAEITSRCDLACPVCLKPREAVFEMSPEEFRESLLKLRSYEESLILLNLSGGEPTLHPRFSEFIDISAELGVAQLTVSTNGLRLLKDKALRDLFIKNRVVAALQFDGLTEATYETLRGRNLLQTKKEIIRIFEQEDLPYSLVTVAARGVSEREIPQVADYFFKSKALSLMIQPAAVSGRAQDNFSPDLRLTIDEVVNNLETSKFIKPGDLAPIACSHPGCAASAYYFKVRDGEFLSLMEFLGLEEYLRVTANRSFPGLEPEGHQIILDKIYDRWSALSPSQEDKVLMSRIRSFLKRLEGQDFSPNRAFEAGRESVKSVFVHGLMDPYSFDLARLVKCCNHYLQAGGRLVPMCAQNLSLSAGKSSETL
ncbi:MAG: radical SAM protein [Deltaproteobacteria bacterium]|jgi:uncharacterized radical SAM superfamily Fe-S cluster-containing enzyme|nr:radical SAM protein [Deltaproteobacteria bacterium]